ncbi:MAG TPA: L-threonylcarbamoyladenylate synthase [Acidimicrobiia bacterium]
MTRPEIARAVEILRSGGLVAFPTETVYGLGADAANRDAVRRLYAVKGRPIEHPVIVHLGAADRLDDWAVTIPGDARKLAAAFWPGPLTLVLRRAAIVPDEVTGGLDTVGLRVPAHPVARALLAELGGGLAAPSANRFGRVSPTTADAVRAELGDAVPLVLDGGPSAVGVESTIVDCSVDPVRVLRVGGVTAEDLRACLGADVPVGGATRAPGTLASHYAPAARVEVVAEDELDARVGELVGSGERVGVLALHRAGRPEPSGAVTLATPDTAQEYAHVLYASLREADVLGLGVVVAVPPPATGIGRAVADRLGRAAAPH